MNFWNMLDWKLAITIAVATSIIVEAIDRLTPKSSHKSYFLVIISLVVTLCKVPLNISGVDSIQNFALSFMVNIAIAILFYTILGHWFVNQVFDLILKMFTKYFGDEVTAIEQQKTDIKADTQKISDTSDKVTKDVGKL